ncbi:ribosome small subunit-dependent GTPase A [Humisphaera borealis]|uniref:Ribosome small subunit-dependent GTPase A n=1 Tax=Humisphaera borealis TaxID=2807512 RepID=A0A7M2X055_9BACT|nr:ribosome small subunit-dependent GTPase A [Humisphaera borealis]QOV90471.1 ribosome small subunit-dependent GTPase A [Humisphaera borealis]
MRGKPKKASREKDFTSRYLTGDFDEDRVEQNETFSERNKTQQHDRMVKTAALREEQSGIDFETLPIGEVIQVFSLFSEVAYQGKTYLCVIRRTLTRTTNTFVVVGDFVRFRIETERGAPLVEGGPATADLQPEGVVEQIMPRKSMLTRADSFKGTTQHPIIANADQVLIVASIRQPYVKWGLIDRMLIAAKAGGLKPIVCLNKVDLAKPEDDGKVPDDLAEANEVLAHYATMDVGICRTSVDAAIGLEEMRDLLANRITVLAGHSGVGKSSLIRAIEPTLDLRVGIVSRYTDKGRHTTTSARRYPLTIGGAVVDTPGVKQFGLWGVTRENLEEFFPDITSGNAPDWRKLSYRRILESLPEPGYT